MTPKFFGQYLLEQDVLTKDQLIASINYQNSKVLKLGEIALSKGYLTEKQIARIHNEQKRQDKMFGELAIEMKLLTDEQFQEILTIQKNSHIYLGEAIVQSGFLTQAQVDGHLANFKDSQKMVPPIEVMIEQDIENKEAVTIMADLTCKLLRRVGDLLSKVGNLRHETAALKNLGVLASLEFKGNLPCKYVFSANFDVAAQIARCYLKRPEPPKEKDLVCDALSEFVNVVCGNVAAKLLEAGKKMEIVPPHCHLDSEKVSLPLTNEKAVIIPIVTPIGHAELAIVTPAS